MYVLMIHFKSLNFGYRSDLLFLQTLVLGLTSNQTTSQLSVSSIKTSDHFVKINVTSYFYSNTAGYSMGQI